MPEQHPAFILVLINIETVRGTPYQNSQPVREFDLNAFSTDFSAQTLELLYRFDDMIIKTQNSHETSYFFINGQKVSLLTPGQSKQLVFEKTGLTPIKARLITQTGKASEYRGRALPLYKITTASSDRINVYLNAYSGEIAAIRSQTWRLWDFL